MTQQQTPYRLKGHLLETCNCEAGCNCNFSGFPDYGTCEAVVGLSIDEGYFGSVDMAGVRAVMAAKWPKAIHEGNGQGDLFVDKGARTEQVEALGAVLTGQAGGMPWEMLATTLDSVEGPVLESIEMTVDGKSSSFRIPGIVEASLTSLKNPVTGEDNEVHIVFPKGGLLWDEAHGATTKTMKVNYNGLSFEYPGKNAFFAPVEWTNQK